MQSIYKQNKRFPRFYWVEWEQTYIIFIVTPYSLFLKQELTWSGE